MANWAALQEQLTGLPVHKRARHAIHFQRPDGLIQAEFVGKPCHWQDSGIWKPIDTTPLIGADGTFGCAHSPVRIGADGSVTVGSGYSQRAKLFSAKNIKVDGDHLVREFTGGEQRLYITEDGFRSEITLFKAPGMSQIGNLIASVNGKLPGGYVESPTSMTDAAGNEYTYDNAANFRKWLEGAVYPVVIDPDFAITDSYQLYGQNADYATARSTCTFSGASTGPIVGQRNVYQVHRIALKFDTSSIGAGSTVNQNNLKMVCTTDQSTADYDVQIAKYDWSGSDPVASGNRETVYDGILAADSDDAIWRNTNGISTNTVYTSGNLAIAWVNKTGSTYYGIRSADDYNNVTPTNSTERITLAGAGHATEAYRPVLTVLYDAAAGIPKHFMHYQRMRG